MKIFLRTPIPEAKENEAQFTEKPIISLMQALIEKKPEEKIHVCYHDEVPVRPCKLL